jgi:HSP20 family molecular chaperone IbpA
MRTLTPWRPMRDLENLHRSMDEMFDRLSEQFFGPAERERSVWGTEPWAPAIESRRDNGNLIVKAYLPGIDSISLNPDTVLKTTQEIVAMEQQQAERRLREAAA